MSVTGQEPQSDVPFLDVVIPIHSTERPLRRAVASVLMPGTHEVRVNVICHNLTAEEVIEATGVLPSAQVTFHEFQDNLNSPAGPRNFGLAKSTAQYVAFLDSDDTYDRNALNTWMQECVDHKYPQILIGQVRSQTGRTFLCPAPRVGRYVDLNATRDLLNDRTALQGALFQREYLSDPRNPRYQSSMPIGEDLSVGLFTWNFARKIAYSRSRRGYYLRSDASDRVTSTAHSLDVRLRPIDNLVLQPWLGELDSSARDAIVSKVIRFEVVSLLRDISATLPVEEESFQTIRATVSQLVDHSDSAIARLAVWESRLVRSIVDGNMGALNDELSKPRLRIFVERLLPSTIRGAMAPEQPLVRMYRTIFGRLFLTR